MERNGSEAVGCERSQQWMDTNSREVLRGGKSVTKCFRSCSCQRIFDRLRCIRVVDASVALCRCVANVHVTVFVSCNMYFEGQTTQMLG
jgi:hypothetical protein